MFAICIESSHQRGMGHLFRALNLARFLIEKKMPHIVLVNDNDQAIKILLENSIPFEVVNLQDFTSGWETALIDKHNIGVWINDRLNTDVRHSAILKQKAVRLVVFDDRGSGAVNADLHIAALVFKDRHRLAGKKILTGPQYLILNHQIDNYKRLRTCCNKILVTLGGSDTYGVTVNVARMLHSYGKTATLVLGPSFGHCDFIQEMLDDGFQIKGAVPSLIQEFREYDLAITGGGVTPFEANASGLPCIILANELHEMEAGEYLDQLGCSIFAGYYKEISAEVFNRSLPIEAMSRKGMETIRTGAIETIWGEIRKC